QPAADGRLALRLAPVVGPPPAQRADVAPHDEGRVVQPAVGRAPAPLEGDHLVLAAGYRVGFADHMLHAVGEGAAAQRHQPVLCGVMREIHGVVALCCHRVCDVASGSRTRAPSFAGMRLMAYSARAAIVRLGLMPGFAGMMDPSTTYSPA